MNTLIDFKNEVARENGFVDWEMFVSWKRSYGDYPAKEHDEAVDRYVKNQFEALQNEGKLLTRKAQRLKRRIK